MTALEAILWALTTFSPEAVEARTAVQAALPVVVEQRYEQRSAPRSVYFAAPVRAANC